jgi:hypothetical protein
LVPSMGRAQTVTSHVAAEVNLNVKQSGWRTLRAAKSWRPRATTWGAAEGTVARVVRDGRTGNRVATCGGERLRNMAEVAPRPKNRLQTLSVRWVSGVVGVAAVQNGPVAASRSGIKNDSEIRQRKWMVSNVQRR